MPAAQGVGIQVGRNVIGQIGHVNLSRDTVETYQKNGVTADGPGSTADISHAVVTGSGLTPASGLTLALGLTPRRAGVFSACPACQDGRHDRPARRAARCR